MALKRQIAKLEDVEEKHRAAYVANPKGEGFVLDAEEDPELGKLSEFRENNRRMKEQLEKWTALGFTPEQAAEKLKAERKKADDEENAKLNVKQLEEKYSKLLSDTEQAAKTEREKLQAKLDAHEIRGPIRQALIAKGAIAGDVDDLIDSLERRGRFRRGSDGKLEFLDEQGDVIPNHSLDKFGEQVRKERARWFEPLKPGGSGTKPSDQPPTSKAERTISADDQAALNASLEDIATGKVAVVAATE